MASVDSTGHHHLRIRRTGLNWYSAVLAFFGMLTREKKMRGICLCGTVEFEIAGEVPRLYQCHCSLCRKQSGSTSNSSLLIKSENFRWLRGEDRISSYVKESGFRSDFCSRCGSPVPNPLRRTSYFWVPSGLLDGSTPLTVGVHVCVGSKASWDVIPEGGVQFEHLPPDLEAFLACLSPR